MDDRSVKRKKWGGYYLTIEFLRTSTKENKINIKIFELKAITILYLQ